MTRIVCISDTHGNKVDVPDGDILIHAGDMDWSWGNIGSVVAFNSWMEELPHKWKVGIAGNHDTIFQARPTLAKKAMTNIIYLEDNSTEIEGLRIFGSPRTIPFAGAFNTPPKELAKLWETIPDDTDILITHGPAYGILDENNWGDHCGDSHLLKRIKQICPKLHVHGHIHPAYGVHVARNGTKHINCAIVDDYHNVVNKPVVVEL